MPPPDLPPRSAPISNPLFEVWRLSRRTAAAVDASLHGDQTGAEYGLYSLIRNLGTTTVTELADQTGSGISTISQQLKRMEERGHVRRTRDPEDGRSWLLSLADDGRLHHEKSSPGFGMLVGDLVEELGRTDHALVMYGLRRLDEALCVLLGMEVEERSVPASTAVPLHGHDLTREQFAEVGRYADWVVWRDRDEEH